MFYSWIFKLETETMAHRETRRFLEDDIFRINTEKVV